MKKMCIIVLTVVISIIVPCIFPCVVSLSITDKEVHNTWLNTSNPPIQLTVKSSIYAEKDAYISTEDTDLGWGNTSYWIVQATDMYPISGIDRFFSPYFYFNYKDFPYDIEEAEIRLSPGSYYPNAFPVRFHLVDSDWDEYNICFNNRPAFIEHNIYHGPVTVGGNVTDYIFDRSNISIMVSADFLEGGTRKASGHTREWRQEGPRPRLILTYSTLFDIIITNPSNHTTLRNGDCVPIRWVTVGPIDNVKIELFKDDSFVSIINSSIENDGLYNWTVGYPEKYEGENYSIRISDVHHSDVYENSKSFTIQSIKSSSFNIIVPIVVGSIIGVALLITLITLILRKRT